MAVSAARLAVSTRRRDRLTRMAALSVLLHLLLLLSFLTLPHSPPLPEASAPASVEIMADVGTAGGEKLPTPSFAPSIVQPNASPPTEPPPPAAAPMPAAPMPELPTPPQPPPAPAASTPAPAAPPAAQAPQTATREPPQPPPPPSDIGVLPLPPPSPAPPPPTAAAPRPSPPPSARATPQRSAPLPLTFGRNSFALPPPTTAPQRSTRGHGPLDLSLGPEALNSVGAPPRASHGLDASIRVEGADLGDDWIQQLHDWWERHAFYPQEALLNGEDGTVQIHLVIRRDGRVTGLEMLSSSGSRWLDMAGESVFRNAALQPFPQSTPQAQADIFLSLQYILLHRR